MALTDPSKRLEAMPPYMFAELERKIADKRAAGIGLEGARVAHGHDARGDDRGGGLAMMMLVVGRTMIFVRRFVRRGLMAFVMPLLVPFLMPFLMHGRRPNKRRPSRLRASRWGRSP